MKKTTYELIDDNLKLIVKLIDNNLMKIDILKNVEIYEVYLSLTGTKTARYKKLSKLFKMSESSIKRYIHKMNKNIK